jgi:hypothetical protein
MNQYSTMTREEYIHAVRNAALAIAILEPAEHAALAGLKMVYGSGYGTGARGVTYFNAWQTPEKRYVHGPECVHKAGSELIEICAFAEESLVQLAGTTVHELGHALAGSGKGHSKDWITACKRLGLRGIKAAGTSYQSAMFVPALRERLATLPAPVDGKVIGWNHGAGSVAVIIAGLAGRRVRPCSQGIGSRGGRSRGPGSGSRLRKFVCSCGVIVRASRDDLAATCTLCGSAFNRA